MRPRPSGISFLLLATALAGGPALAQSKWVDPPPYVPPAPSAPERTAAPPAPVPPPRAAPSQGPQGPPAVALAPKGAASPEEPRSGGSLPDTETRPPAQAEARPPVQPEAQSHELPMPPNPDHAATARQFAVDYLSFWSSTNDV